MTYYRIKESIDKKIIGKYPQVEEVIIPTTWEDPAFIGCYTNTRAPRNVLVTKAILNKTSKVTDLVSGVAVGLARNLLVSDEFKFLLEVSNYYGVDFFETSLKVFNAEELSYWIVHPYKSYYEALDLEKSSFFWSDINFQLNPEKRVYITSVDQLLDGFKEALKQSDLPLLQRKILVIGDTVFKQDCEIDFLTISRIADGGIGFYVSERLKEIIEKQKCTGIVFNEIK